MVQAAFRGFRASFTPFSFLPKTKHLIGDLFSRLAFGVHHPIASLKRVYAFAISSKLRMVGTILATALLGNIVYKKCFPSQKNKRPLSATFSLQCNEQRRHNIHQVVCIASHYGGMLEAIDTMVAHFNQSYTELEKEINCDSFNHLNPELLKLKTLIEEADTTILEDKKCIREIVNFQHSKDSKPLVSEDFLALTPEARAYITAFVDGPPEYFETTIKKWHDACQAQIDLIRTRLSTP